MPPPEDQERPTPPPLPEPTMWPATIAGGVTLLAWGAVTSPIFSAVGALTFVAGVAGWVRELRRDARAGREREGR